MTARSGFPTQPTSSVLDNVAKLVHTSEDKRECSSVSLIPTSGSPLICADESFERIVLGSLIENPTLFTDKTVAQLSPEDFFQPSHSILFKNLQQVFHAGEPINVATLWNRLETRGEGDRVGGLGFVVQLADGVVERTNIDFFVQRIREYATRRRLAKNARRLSEQALDRGTPLSELETSVAILSARYTLGDQAERKFRFRTAPQITLERLVQQRWIAEPYVVPGAITELVGKPKSSGKTTFVTRMAKAILEGTHFLGEPTTTTNIVYLTEQSDASFTVALRRAGLAEKTGLTVLSYKDTFGKSWPETAAAAVAQCVKSNAGLLIVDTIGQFAGLTGDSENNSGDALIAMAPLQRAAAQGIAVLVIRHERKSGGEVGESGRGSSAFAGAVDVVMTLRKLEGNQRTTLREIRAVSRFDGTPDRLVIELTPEGYVSHGASGALALDEGKETILRAASRSKAMTLGELSDGSSISRTSAQRALDDLIREGKLLKTGKGRKNDPLRYLLAENSFCPNPHQ